MSADVELVSKLGDQPNQENGLTAEELKAVFDRGSKRLKEYVNETLVPAVNELAESDDESIKNDQLPKAINAALDQAKESGEFDGGYYVPIVDQTNASTMRIEFTPSDQGAMPPVEPVRIELPPGPRGATGKTAYAYAKEGGYTGTEEEFAAKLAAEMPDALPNPAALVINRKTYYGHMVVDMTDTINSMIDAKKEAIPTALSELNEDETHRTVTDAEKQAWNAKSDFSGNYEDLTNKPTISTRILLWGDNTYVVAGSIPAGEAITIPNDSYTGIEVVFRSAITNGFRCSTGFIPFDGFESCCAVGRVGGGTLVSMGIAYNPKYSQLVFTGGYNHTTGAADSTVMFPVRIYGYK